MERQRQDAINREMRRARYRITAAERKRRTRRLILMGSCIEHIIATDEAAKRRFMQMLDDFLERDRDRETLRPVSKGGTLF